MKPIGKVRTIITLIAAMWLVGASLSFASGSIDFNTTTDLANNFNSDGSVAFTNPNSGGLGNSGYVLIPSSSTDIWTSKTGYTLTTGATYTLSVYFHNQYNSGYAGMGFAIASTNTHLSKANPASALGVNIHGGGGGFVNNTTSASESAVTWGSGDLADNTWFKFTYTLTYNGSNSFDAEILIQNSDNNGTISTTRSQQTLNGITNSNVGGATTIYPYFGNTGSRMDGMDNYSASQTGRSAVVNDDIFLEGTYVSVGIAGDGSFGTDSNAPAGFHPYTAKRNTLGLSIDQDGFDSGAAATTGDFFLPGTQEESFTVGFKTGSTGGTAYNFTNAERRGTTQITPTSIANQSSGNTLQARFIGKTTDNKLQVTQAVSFDVNSRFFKTKITLTNIASETLYSVRYMRSFDPDQDSDINSVSNTTNEVVENRPGDARSIVKATGPNSGVPVFFISYDNRSRASRFGFTNRDVYAASAYDSPTAKGTSSTADEAITMTLDVGNLTQGASESFNFYTSLDSDLSGSLTKIQTQDNLNTDGSLTAGTGVSEPVAIPSTATTTGAAVDIFDFKLTDGGGGDATAMTVSQVMLNTSGTGPFSKLAFRLNGPDASNVSGTYNSSNNTISFTGLSLSVADGANETYTVNAYYSDNTGLTEDQTLILSVDGDVDLTLGANGTAMGTTTAVTNGTGSTVDITATKLAFTTQPAGSVSGSAFTAQPVVTAQDAVGNTDVDFTDTVTLTESAPGSLASNTKTAALGVATFSGLTYTATADQQSFTLTADDQVGGAGGDLATVNANAVTSDVVATQLVFTTQPAGSVSGSALTTQPVVEARDANNVKDTGFAEVVTLTEGSAGSLANATATASSGVATFSGLAYTATVDQQSFILTANDVDGTGSNLPTVNASAVTSDVVATQLVFTTQPAGSVSGSALTTQPVVEARDANNVKDTGFAEVVTLTENSAGSLTNGTATASSGVATFSNLAYTATADQQSFTLTANDVDGTDSNLPTVNANPLTSDVVATQLVFTTQPTGSTSGSALTTQPIVEARDAQNVKDTGFTEVVTLTESSAGSLTSNTITASSGVATFSGLTYTATADQQPFTLTANDVDGTGSNLPTVNANAVTSDVVATQLVFTTQPAGSVSGSALTTQPIVEARDAQNVKDTGFTEVVTLTESSAGNLTSATATASSGVATFSGLTYTATADQQPFTLTANDVDGTGSNLPTVNANPLTSDVVATQLVFTTQPTGSTSGSALTTQPIVEARDAQNVKDTGFAELVTLTEFSAGSLTSNTTTASSGVATFSGLTYTATADQQSFILTANDVDGAGSNLPTVNANAVTSDVVATQLVFTTQPAGSVSGSALTTQPIVEARDAQNVKDTGFAELVTLTESSAGSLTSSTATASSGVATFSGLTYTATADQQPFTLTANDVDGTDSNLPTVNANAVTSDVVAIQLVFTTQPVPLIGVSGLALDFTIDPVVEARDANGVKDIDFTDAVTLTETGSGSATYTGNSVTAVSGMATFSGLTVTYAATADGETFGLYADDTAGGSEGDLTSLPTSSSITSDVVATQLVFTTQPTGSISGSALTTQPVVEARDAQNVKDTGFAELVTLTESSAGSLTNTTATASSGVATFSGLTYTATADQQPFTLTANDIDGTGSNLPTVNANAVTSDVVATQLVFTTQPAGSVSGSALTTQPIVEARDAQNVKDTGFTEVVTLTESSAGNLTSATATASSGVATFSGLTYTATADQQPFTLTANDVDGTGSNLPTVNANAVTSDVVATQLVFTTQPTGSTSGSALATQPVVEARDAQNVKDTGFAEVVTLTESSAGSLTNTTATASSGVATFSGLTYTATTDGESFTLTANDQDGAGSDLPTVNANPLISDVVATQLVFATQPAGSVSGSALITQPVVEARDAQNVKDTGFAELVTLTESSAGSLTNATATATSGMATFSGMAYTATTDGESFTLTANDQDGTGSDLPTVAANALTSDVVATQLVFITQPLDSRRIDSGDEVVNGLVFQTQPVVEARDANGLRDAGFAEMITLARTAGSGTLSGAAAVAAVGGVATFSGLAYTATADGEGFALTADDAAGGVNPASALTSGLSADAVATQLVFTTQPGNGVHGQALSVQPVVEAHDASGLRDADFSETITLSASAGTALENAVAASAGIATFAQLSVQGAGAGRTLAAAASPTAINGTSSSFDVAKAQATVSLSGWTGGFDGQPKSLTGVTTPAGLPMVYSYTSFTGVLSDQAPAGPGIYEVTATVQHGDYVGNATARLTIETPPPPAAVLRASTIRGAPPLTVHFTDASTGYITGRVLEIFDGRAADADILKKAVDGELSQPMEVAFDRVGIYEAVLSLRGHGGASGTTLSIVVHPPLPAPPGSAPPHLSGLTSEIAFSESEVNEAAKLIDSEVVLRDGDSPDMDGGALKLEYRSGGSAQDQLSIRDQGSGEGEIGFAAGTVRFEGTEMGALPLAGEGSGLEGNDLLVRFNDSATIEAVEALIENLTYRNSSDFPTPTRTLSLFLEDGDGSKSMPASITITVESDFDVVWTVAGGGSYNSGSFLSFPFDLFVAESGELYIADTGNHRIRKVATDGMMVTVAGTGRRAYSGDGGPATQARLREPRGVFVTASGEIYIADTNNHCIRKVATDGTISTVAGIGVRGFSGDGGPATQARLSQPWSVAALPSGEVYITDTNNHRIRKVATDGTISTVVGTGVRGFSGDGGPATQAQLNSPGVIVALPSSEIYIADTNNHRIRKIGTNGTISTVAGMGEPGFSGDGGPATQARLLVPRGISVSPSGVLYIADTFNHRVRKVEPDGTISTVMGAGSGRFSGEGGRPQEVHLSFPFGLFALDRDLYVADTNHQRIRRAFGSAAEAKGEGYVAVRGKVVDLTNQEDRGVGLDVEGWLVRGLFGADAQVGLDDFFLFADHYGRTRRDPEFAPAFDLDGNGAVDMDDFFLLADNFGRMVVNHPSISRGD